VGNAPDLPDAPPPSVGIRTHGFRVLFATLVLALAVLPAAAAHSRARLLVAIGVSISLAAILYAARGSGRLLWIGATLFVLALAGWWREALGLPAIMDSVGTCCGALFYGFSAAALWAPVFRSRRITEDTLVGTLCIFLLACLSFALAYLLAWELDPAAFSFTSWDPGSHALADFVYFSFVTATTLGYGDVVPVATWVRSLVILQSVAGVLYASISVARLVALHAAGGEAPPLVSSAPSGWQHSRNLLLLMIGLILLLPLLPSGGLAFIDSALLIAVLYALIGGHRLFGVTLLAAGLSLVAGWWGRDDPAGYAWIASEALELVCYAIGLSVVSLMALRERAVTVDAIYGACNVYLLFGIAFANLFGLLAALAPGSLAVEPVDTAELLYFGFMTLTTTGYGDITPLTPATHGVASLAATVGIFYPAILVARLVSLYGAEE
jgi:hypothetical protein